MLDNEYRAETEVFRPDLFFLIGLLIFVLCAAFAFRIKKEIEAPVRFASIDLRDNPDSLRTKRAVEMLQWIEEARRMKQGAEERAALASQSAGYTAQTGLVRRGVPIATGNNSERSEFAENSHSGSNSSKGAVGSAVVPNQKGKTARKGPPASAEENSAQVLLAKGDWFLGQGNGDDARTLYKDAIEAASGPQKEAVEKKAIYGIAKAAALRRKDGKATAIEYRNAWKAVLRVYEEGTREREEAKYAIEAAN